MLVLLFVTIVFALIVIQDMLRKRSGKWIHLNKFPGDWPLPLIGNALTLGFDSDVATQRLMEIWERHGKRTFHVSVGSENWVLLSEPDDVAVLFSDSSVLSKSPERNAAVSPFFGNSVSTSEGDRWRWARKLVLSSFHVKSLQQRVDVVNERSELLYQILAGFQNKEPVSLYRYMRPFMLDVLFNSLMGVDSDFLNDPDHPYLIESGKVINMITENYFSYWRNIRPLFKLTSTYQENMKAIKMIQRTGSEVIEQRRKKLFKIREDIQKNNKTVDVDIEELLQKRIKEENCLLDTYLLKNLPNGEQVPHDVINEEISFIYFTGHFTTAVTISHTLYSLAKHPHIQARVMEEQKSIFNDDFLRRPKIQDLNEMKYLEAVVKETLRTIPTVSKIGRKLHKDLVLKDGRVIPAGTTAIVYYEAIFASEKVFEEPTKFNPDRFFDNDMHTHAFLPFGGGPRSCIGFRFAWMAMKATLSNILRRFEVSEARPDKQPEFSYRIVTESKNGVHLRFKEREALSF